MKKLINLFIIISRLKNKKNNKNDIRTLKLIYILSMNKDSFFYIVILRIKGFSNFY